jgi:hypothetical protein
MLVELRPKSVAAPASDPDLETRLWMDTDLSRLGELEPYDWGTAGPPPGERVVFDPEHGAIALPGLMKCRLVLAALLLLAMCWKWTSQNTDH